MIEVLREALLHGFVAAVYAAGLIRAWGVSAPALRWRLWALTLAAPLVLTPALALALPVRHDPAFRSRYMLFDSARLARTRLFSTRLDVLALGACGTVAAIILARDAGALFSRLARSSGRRSPSAADVATLRATIGVLADRLGLAAPAVELLDDGAPFIACSGLGRRATIHVSRGLVARLDARALEAALAHELGHLSRADPARGWALLAARALLFFHPAAQLAARQMVQEVETLADARALALGAGAGPLCDALRHLAPVDAGDDGDGARGLGLGNLAARGARTLIDARCRLVELGIPKISYPRARAGLALAGLVALLVLVT